MKTRLSILLLLLVILSANAQNKYYVDAKSGAYSGRNWNLANNDLQGMINKASPGDTILVAAGIYKGGFFMKEGVFVLGGFTANIKNPAERIFPGEAIFESQLSILDGDGIQRVVTQVGDFATPTYWEGFVVRNGKPSVELQPGSIIYAADGSNHIAGIVYKYDGILKKGMMIGVNDVKKQWGGYQDELPELVYLSAPENIAQEIDGRKNTEIICRAFGDKNMDFTHPEYQLNGNYAAKWCQSFTSGGYDDWFLPSCSDMHEIAEVKTAVNNTLIALNKELRHGYWTSSHLGDLVGWTFHFESGQMAASLKYLEKNVRPVCEFQVEEPLSDMYYVGGGACLKDNGILMNCIIRDNESSSQGGGVYMERGAQVLGCLIHDNSAKKGGSGIYVLNNDDTSEAKFSYIRNSTIINNLNATGVEIIRNGTKIENSIIWGNTDATGSSANANEMSAISYSCVQDGETINQNINQDPVFTDMKNNDFTLQESSPCLKKGTISAITTNKFFLRDLKGYTRVIFQGEDAFADMGAYQHGETDRFLNKINLVNYPDSEIRIHPNLLKCNDILTVSSLKEYKNIQIDLIDNTGRVVKTQKHAGNENRITAPQNPGLYYLRINADNTIRIYKIIVY